MVRYRAGIPLDMLRLDPEAPEPLFRQLAAGLTRAIRTGVLRPETRFPSSRTLAADLGVSRNTVLSAFDVLIAAGYLVARQGGGTFVAKETADLFPAGRPADTVSGPPPSSDRARRILRHPDPATGTRPRVFSLGLPALDAFPMSTWRRIAVRVSRSLGPCHLAPSDPAGIPELRSAIADYLAVSRGVRASADQVIVLSSSQQALDLMARLALDPGDAAWVEDPCYPGASGALAAAGARLVPVPVDHHGLLVAAGCAAAPDARLAYVTPSHQYPLGMTLSQERRLALLAWAAERGAWIVEDDYDGEFRYEGPPLEALQGLDRHGRVVYVGTFSKVLYPAIRLAYLVAPAGAVVPLLRLRALMDGHPPLAAQLALHEFIAAGHFESHLRRMRSVYRERRDALVEAIDRHLADRMSVAGDGAGLHLAGLCRRPHDEADLAEKGRGLGLDLARLSAYYAGPTPGHGLLFGYAGFSPEVIAASIRSLAAA